LRIPVLGKIHKTDFFESSQTNWPATYLSDSKESKVPISKSKTEKS
jgi:hypothetical protein